MLYGAKIRIVSDKSKLLRFFFQKVEYFTRKTINPVCHCFNVGKAYINALNKLDENHPENVNHILDILDCVHPDPGYNFGIYIEEPWKEGPVTHRCDQSWFHCYQGIEEPIMRRPYGFDKWKDGDSENVLYLRFTFEMFLHLSIDPTPMGVWQAYLLCISKTVLPFSGILYYTKRELIFQREQFKYIHFLEVQEIESLYNLETDLSPKVSIDGNKAVVSCCYWNDWGGLFREYVEITFLENGKVKIGDFTNENYFKYDLGIRY